MAGDWIKVEQTLPDKPEVLAIAAILDLDPDAVVGKLVRVWIWADQHTTDGNARGVTRSFIDRCAAIPGFADAMVSVGWLLFGDGCLMIPNFDHHNGETAKARALTGRRVASHRAARNGRSVTPALPKPLPEGEGEVEGDPPSPDPTSTGGLAGAAVDFDLVFGSHPVCASLKRKLPPKSDQDRRLFAKIAVLVDRGLLISAWVNEACDSTVQSRREKPIGYFHGCLRTRCQEQKGVDFTALLDQVEFSTNGRAP